MVGRILTSHAGSLPHPDDLRGMLIAKDSGQPNDVDGFNLRVRSAVAEVVRKQVESGVDIVNDGELSKIIFRAYARQRMSGVEERKAEPGRLSPLPVVPLSTECRRRSVVAPSRSAIRRARFSMPRAACRLSFDTPG